MKVLQISTHDAISGGGAARAAMRLHLGLLKNGIDSKFHAVQPSASRNEILYPLNRIQHNFLSIKQRLAARILRLQNTPGNTALHSLGWFSSNLGTKVNASDCDVVNLHWICGEALSIRDIGSITKPVVWTMHDMWPFSGTEHYDDLSFPERWRETYQPENRPMHNSGLDLDACSWRLKLKYWKDANFNLIAPSSWLADCARRSALLKSHACTVVPNPFDDKEFSPINKKDARNLLRLPIDRRLLLFGAQGATADPRKGFDLLAAALRSPKLDISNLEIVIFGGGTHQDLQSIPLKVHLLGRTESDEKLRTIYSATDVFVAPSRQDNLPNTVVEAGACGLPTVAFNIGGMPDLIIPGETGELAPAFDTDALASCITRALNRQFQPETIRHRMIDKVGFSTTIPKYIAIYRAAIAAHPVDVRHDFSSLDVTVVAPRRTDGVGDLK